MRNSQNITKQQKVLCVCVCVCPCEVFGGLYSQKCPTLTSHLHPLFKYYYRFCCSCASRLFY